MPTGTAIELATERPNIYAGHAGQPAIVTATSATGTLIRVHWVWAVPGEVDGWYEAGDFRPRNTSGTSS